ncbi:MAG: RES domain-containing protein, partial [Spirochaetae bacterium HGW-Spirochaetae-10]
EWNYVINPQHPAIAEVRLLKIEEKPLDLRLA